MNKIEQPQQYLYPAVFTPPHDDNGRWSVRFPDLAKDERVDAKTLEEAMLCAHDILKAHVASLKRRTLPMPLLTPCGNVTVNDGEILQLVVASLEDPKNVRQYVASIFSSFVKSLIVVLILLLFAMAMTSRY
jgi:predicted RNase H-like HicB family nuclease